MPVRVITAAAAEPVTLTEAKTQLRLETTEDDTHLAGILIPAAREWVEKACNRLLSTQVIELVIAAFPASGELELPRGKLCSVTISEDTFANGVVSVKYLDDAGVEQTLATADYNVDDASDPGRVLLGYDKTWPTTRVQWNAVVVRYAVGWAVADVPKPLKQAILLLVSQMYENRVPEVTGTIISKVGFAVESLLSHYKIASVG